MNLSTTYHSKIYEYMNEITKKKISLKLRGKKKTATHIKQSLIGRKLSKEHKEHISQSMKNKPQRKV